MHDYYFSPSDDHPDEARAIARAQQLLEHFTPCDDDHDDDDHGSYDDHHDDDDDDNGEFDTISDFERRLQLSVIFSKYAYSIFLLSIACVCFTASAWFTYKLLN